MLTAVLGAEPAGLTDENLQSRLRGVLLMAVSNATGAIVLTTGNKSELATGYSTLYGDSAGGFAVIKDVPKTLVYELAARGTAVPRRTAGSDRSPPPSWRSRPRPSFDPTSATTSRSPPTTCSTRCSQTYVEQDRTASDLVADGFDPAIVEQVVRLVDGAEYKRRQMPPGVRITQKAFGKDRRMPITNHYRPARRRAARGWLTPERTRLLRPSPSSRPPRSSVATGGSKCSCSPSRVGGRSGTARPTPGSTSTRRSARHGWHAELWADRLPVLDGVDPEALTRPPSPAAEALFGALAGSDDGPVPLAGGWPASISSSCRGCSPPTSGTSNGRLR